MKKKILFTLVTITIISLFFLLTVEIFSRVKTGLKTEEVARFYQQLNEVSQYPDGCGVFDTYMLSSSLGYVANTSMTEKCYFNHQVNNIGIDQTYNYPTEKDPKNFSILVVGGSVAHQLSKSNTFEGENTSFLAKALSEYKFPQQKKIKVYSGSLAGWRQPTELMMIMQFGDLFDAIISVEGFNEFAQNELKAPIDGAPVEMTFFGYGALSKTHEILTGTVKSIFENKNSWLVKNSHFLYLWTRNVLDQINREINDHPRIHQHELKNFYGNLSEKQYTERNIKKYQAYLKAMSVASQTLGLKYAFFLQPIRWIDKSLTENERSHVRFVSRENYVELIDLFNSLQAKGLNTYSATGILKGNKEEIYKDHIHFEGYPEEGEFSGYEILANFIAKNVAKAWGLKLRGEKN